MHDVIIIGGSYAGQAAALQLARARRRVLVIDAGLRRNRFAAHSHGFLGRDGVAPGDIAMEAKAQLLRYPTVTWVDGAAVSAKRADSGFAVSLADGSSHAAARIILSGGVRDILPAIPGLGERWGRSVFMCPYCDGYELDRGAIAVIATSPNSIHQAMLLADWGNVTFFLNGAFEPNAEETKMLAARGVAIEAAPVSAIEGERADIVLADGRRLSFVGAFTTPSVELSSPIPFELGCETTDSPLGPVIKVNAMAETSIEDVFACGDITRGAGSVSLAVGDGAMAGVSVHRSLIFPKAAR